jgi:glyoxylase-like metal-dependent hydrolase (beta-lactamase superfamily II)/rhodanese-related sulfurtransferase
MIFKQFNVEGCLSYVIACSSEKAGAIIDPSHSMEAYLEFVRSHDLQILYVLDTHSHVDHVSLAPELADILKAKSVMCKAAPVQREIGARVKKLFGIETIIAENGTKRIDLFLEEGEELTMGGVSLKALFTPGHTRDSMCLLSNGKIFTGDTLLIGQCGRTDLPGGSSKEMHGSLFRKLMALSDDLVIYPAHDYKGNINSSLGYERINNICLKTKRTVEAFSAFLKGLFPPLDSAGGKLQCGLTAAKEPGEEAPDELNPLMKTLCISMEQYLTQPHETTIIRPEELLEKLKGGERVLILDVRQPEELSQLGFIKGAVNIPVSETAKRVSELPADLNAPIVTVCESGSRSAHAALYLRAYGYNNVKNLEYGMRGWRTEGFPIVYPENP